ncbi:MAG: nickel insertion protein [Vulcanimicrobiaceae bacterium]
MRAAFFDLIGGASGNMLFGAFVDAGTNFDEIVKALRTIPVHGWSIVRERTRRRGVEATYIDVIVPGEDDHHDHADAHRHPPGTRTFAEIMRIFETSQLSQAQVTMACTIAQRLARAESHESGVELERLRFHPVGQIDAILDIAATSIALAQLNVEQVFCSAFPIGRKLPGETAWMLAGKATRSEDVAAEMVTTTAAAILSALVQKPGFRPELRVELSGYGAGRSDFRMPNVTRVEIGPLA